MSIQFKQIVSLSDKGSFQIEKDPGGVLVLTLSDGNNSLAVKLTDQETLSIARDMQFILQIVRDDAKA